MGKIEPILGGALALFLIWVAFRMIFDLGPPAPPSVTLPPPSDLMVEDCEDAGYRLGDFSDFSSAYRAGADECRRYLGDDGFLAWRKGWEEGRLICQCYNKASKLATSEVGVMSAQYRSGQQECRATLNERGGNAWTAGWNASLSSDRQTANCSAYLWETAQ
ncbi:MAG: hypothetical protein WD076_08810 [Parvularculaceae bacterium]